MADSWYDEYELPDGYSVNGDGRLEDDYGTIAYMTDGACMYNGLPNSYGGCAFFSGPECFNSWEDPEDRPTNQTSELGAIFGAVRRAHKEGENDIKILTDSMYCKNAISYWPNANWRPNARDDGTWLNSKGNEVANQWLIRKILNSMKHSGIVAEFIHVDRSDNEIADRMAKEARDE